MGRNAETEELKRWICIWRQLQEEHNSDLLFFHYSQKRIDSLEYGLDRIARQVE